MTESSFHGARAAELTAVVVPLLKGVLYQDNDAVLWAALLRIHARVRDYVAVLGLELVLDESEGYAFLRSRTPDREDESVKRPRLVARRPLSFPVSLLLALLRKKLAEHDASGGDTRLVLTRDDVAELIRVFMPATTNETRLVDQVDAHIAKIIDLGFLRRLKAGSQSGDQDAFEVRRILKAFVDAQWLADFDVRLAEYQAQLASGDMGASHD